MYGSNFCSVTRYPWPSSSRPIEAAARPFPSEDTTPPVMKMYLVGMFNSSWGCPERLFHRLDVVGSVDPVVAPARPQHLDRAAPLERAELLQPFELFQDTG